MNGHRIIKQFIEPGVAWAQGAAVAVDVHVVHCNCGWKEKAPSERLSLERFRRHALLPRRVGGAWVKVP